MINVLGTRRQQTASSSPRNHTDRLARSLVAAGVLTLCAGLGMTSAAATGESTTAVLTSPLSGSSTTFTWSYQFHDNGGHDLSNIAVRFCSSDILSHVVSASPSGEIFLSGDVPGGHTGFGPGVKFDTTAVSGTLTIVFDRGYISQGSLFIQSHSGDGQDGDIVEEAVGPGVCNAQPTSSTVARTSTTAAPTTTVAPTTTTAAPTTTVAPTTTTVASATTTLAPTTTTTRLPLPQVTTTAVAAATTTKAPVSTTTAPATTTSRVPATTSTSVPTSVLGERFSHSDPAARLVKTGFNGGPLEALGTLAVVLGMILLVGVRLRPAD